MIWDLKEGQFLGLMSEAQYLLYGFVNLHISSFPATPPVSEGGESAAHGQR